MPVGRSSVTRPHRQPRSTRWFADRRVGTKVLHRRPVGAPPSPATVGTVAVVPSVPSSLASAGDALYVAGHRRRVEDLDEADAGAGQRAGASCSTCWSSPDAGRHRGQRRRRAGPTTTRSPTPWRQYEALALTAARPSDVETVPREWAAYQAVRDAGCIPLSRRRSRRRGVLRRARGDGRGHLESRRGGAADAGRDRGRGRPSSCARPGAGRGRAATRTIVAGPARRPRRSRSLWRCTCLA